MLYLFRGNMENHSVLNVYKLKLLLIRAVRIRIKCYVALYHSRDSLVCSKGRNPENRVQLSYVNLSNINPNPNTKEACMQSAMQQAIELMRDYVIFLASLWVKSKRGMQVKSGNNNNLTSPYVSASNNSFAMVWLYHIYIYIYIIMSCICDVTYIIIHVL